MKKKILMGSIIAVALLLLMPSIPAVQQKTVEDKAYSDFVEELKNVDLKDIDVLDGVKHPILYNIVISLWNYRLKRCVILLSISLEGDGYSFHIIHPLILLRAVWLTTTLYIWGLFWNNVSDKFGWGWEF